MTANNVTNKAPQNAENAMGGAILTITLDTTREWLGDLRLVMIDSCRFGCRAAGSASNEKRECSLTGNYQGLGNQFLKSTSADQFPLTVVQLGVET